MNRNIYGFHDLNYTDFAQASVYPDACFLLAFLDYDDVAGEIVEETLNIWKNHGIKYMGISNHTMSEVVQFLYTGLMINVIYTAYRKNVKKEILTADEDILLGDGIAAMRLMNIIGVKKLRLMEQGRFNLGVYQIKEAIKIYKSRYQDRETLNVFYERILDNYNDLFHSIEQDFGIEVLYLISNEEVTYTAQEFMRNFQLEISDSIHLAIAKEHKVDYFFTLDGDYVHNLYENEEMGNTQIYHLANHAI